MKKRFLLSFVFVLMAFSLFAETKTVVDISVKTEKVADSEAAWLAPAVAEKLEANLSKYTDFTFVNSANRKDIFKIQAESENGAFDEEDAIEIGKLKNADYVLFTTLRKAGEEYTISVRLTNVTTGVNKVSAILSSPRSSVQNLYSSNGCAVDEITVEFCKALGTPLSNTEKTFLMNGDLTLSKEEKQSVYDADVKLYNKRIEELNKEISSVSSSTDLEAVSKQEKLKAEKVLAEEKLKLAQENQRRVAEEIKQRKADELKNSERTAEQKERLNSMSKELNEKVQSVRNAKFDNESLVGQIQVIELKKKAAVDIHNSIMSERKNIFDATVKNILDKKKQIEERPYRAAELLEDGKTPSDFAIKQRENIYNKTKDKLIVTGQGDIDQVTGKLGSQKSTLLVEINNDYSKLNSRKISTLGNELVVTYGAYNGDKQGWNLNVTVKSDNIILFQTKSFLSFESLTGKDPEEYAMDDYFAYLDDVDFYDSLFLRGEPILIFELEYSAKPEDVTKPSQYNFSFYNFKCYDTQTLKVNGNNISSSKTNNLVLDDKNIIRQMSPVCDLQPALEDLPTLEKLVKVELEEIQRNEIIKSITISTVKRLPSGTSGSYGTKGTYVEFGNWPQTVKADDVTIDTSKTLSINGWTCYKGSDNCYYVKSKADTWNSYYFDNRKRISDGTYYYFKLEPIKWRVVTNNYQGGKLLVAENILAAKRFDSDYNNYKNSEIRSWLNDGFINSAFTKEAIKSINTVTVDNSVKSTGYSENEYACENTSDKIFLLSNEEVTRSSYGFDSDKYGHDTARIRKTTDYSRATGAYSETYEEYKNNGWLWLRSPFSNYCDIARVVDYGGSAFSDYYGSVDTAYGGVVPALSISF